MGPEIVITQYSHPPPRRLFNHHPLGIMGHKETTEGIPFKWRIIDTHRTQDEDRGATFAIPLVMVMVAVVVMTLLR